MVKITDECISCSSCIDECEVDAILDEDDNPDGNNYYVQQGFCVECAETSDVPSCALACPTEGAIVWSDKGREVSPSRPDDAINQNVIND